MKKQGPTPLTEFTFFVPGLTRLQFVEAPTKSEARALLKRKLQFPRLPVGTVVVAKGVIRLSRAAKKALAEKAA